MEEVLYTGIQLSAGVPKKDRLWGSETEQNVAKISFSLFFHSTEAWHSLRTLVS